MLNRAHIKDINTIDTNFRSDVIAAGMVDGGIDADRIVILRRDGSVRETDKEVISIEYRPDWEGNGRDVLLLRANRQGIYDLLPEGLFHNPAGLKDSGKEAIVHSFKVQSKEEFFIRRFFSLYESESENTRVEIQLAEYRYDRPDRHRIFVDTMSALWPVIRRMDALTAMLFIRSVPYIADIRGSYGQTAQALSMITGYDVRIEEKSTTLTPKGKYTRLAAMKLGVNSVLKGRMAIHYAEVSVTPPRESIPEVLPGKTQYHILETLLEVFLPNDIDYKISVKPRPEDFTNRPGDRDNPCILGVNAKLKSKERYESEEQ